MESSHGPECGKGGSSVELNRIENAPGRFSGKGLALLAFPARLARKALRLTLEWVRMGTRDTACFLPGVPSSPRIFSEERRSVRKSLDHKELRKFRKDGWVGPFSLLGKEGVRRATETHLRTRRKFMAPMDGDPERPSTFDRKPWHKSRHAYVPEFFDICRNPRIVEKVSSILGPDLMAWGLTTIEAAPGRNHRWHVDVEHRHWRGVTVFLGLRGITLRSTLKVISGSHRIDKTPQELDLDSDEAALRMARKLSRGCDLVPMPLSEGDFFIFDGPLWHGSLNTDDRTRFAIIIQYCRPDQPVRMPMEFDGPIRWHPRQLPCVLVKGRDRWGVNRLVGRPGSPQGSGLF